VIVLKDLLNVLQTRNVYNLQFFVLLFNKLHAVILISPFNALTEHAERMLNNVLLNPDVLPDSLFAPIKLVLSLVTILNSLNVPPIKCSNAKIKLVYQNPSIAELESHAVTLT